MAAPAELFPPPCILVTQYPLTNAPSVPPWFRMHVGSSLSIQLNFKTQNERPLLPACTDMQGARATISAARPVRNKHEISQFPLAISLLPKKIYRPYFNSNFQLSHNSFVENKGLVRPTMKEKKNYILDQSHWPEYVLIQHYH